MSVKILATADLHLGRTSSGVPENLQEASTKYTWHRMVDWCIQRSIDVLLLCGDIIDRDNRYFEALGPLQRGFEKLGEAGIQVYMVAGNHDFDVLFQIAGNNQYENIHLLGAKGEWETDTYSGEDLSVKFAGWSFPGRHYREDPLQSFSRSGIESDIPLIGLLHGEVNEPESRYAPTDLNKLTDTPMDAWIIGHIHKPQDLKKEDPYIAYPGSPHALNSGEPGLHGALLLEVEGRDDFHTHRILFSPVRYESLSIDVSEAGDKETFRERVTASLFNNARKKLDEEDMVSVLVYDLYLEGKNKHVREIDSWLLNISDYEPELNSGSKVSIRKVINRVEPAIENLEELAKDPSPAGKLAETILVLQQGNTTPFLENLLQEWKLQHQKISGTPTYLPLKSAERLSDDVEQEGRRYILSECRRLLGVLLSQQEN